MLVWVYVCTALEAFAESGRQSHTTNISLPNIHKRQPALINACTHEASDCSTELRSSASAEPIAAFQSEGFRISAPSLYSRERRCKLDNDWTATRYCSVKRFMFAMRRHVRSTGLSHTHTSMLAVTATADCELRDASLHKLNWKERAASDTLEYSIAPSRLHIAIENIAGSSRFKLYTLFICLSANKLS